MKAGMLETRVRVVAATETQAWVVAAESSGCGACASRANCGVSGLGRYFSRRAAPVQLGQPGARCGDELEVRVSEAELLRAGLFAYLVPAVLAALAAAWADAQGAGDGLAALAAAGGFVAGLIGARLFVPVPHLQPFFLPSSLSSSLPSSLSSSSSLPPGAPHD